MIMQGTGLVITHTSSPEPRERPVDLGSDAPTLQGNSHAPTHICHTQFRSPSAALGREGGLGDSPMCISLRVHTTSSEPPVRCVRFGSDGPKLHGDSHTPAPFFRTHWMGLSALLGRDGGLGDSPMCISLQVHSTSSKPPVRCVRFSVLEFCDWAGADFG